MNKTKAVIALALIILLHSFSWIALKGSVAHIEQENGIMENYQAICLVLAMVVLFIGIHRSRIRAEKIFYAGLVLFTGTLLVLEVDFRQMNAPLLNTIMNGKIRNIWLGTFWLVGIVLFARNIKPVVNSFLAWLRTPAALLMIAGGVFWVLSALIDKSLLGKKDLFNEELMEVNATLLMTASAALSLYIQKQRSVAASVRDSAPLT